MTAKTYHPAIDTTMDLNDAVSRYELNLRDRTINDAFPSSAVVQAALATGAWGATVIKLERSVNGSDWVDLSSATSLSAVGVVTAAIDAPYLRARVSTVAGVAGVARVSIVLITETT